MTFRRRNRDRSAALRPRSAAERGETLVEAVVALSQLVSAALPALAALRIASSAVRAAADGTERAFAAHVALRTAEAELAVGKDVPEVTVRHYGPVRVETRRTDGAVSVRATGADAIALRLLPREPGR